MPKPRSWASPGGIAPSEPSSSISLNHECLHEDSGLEGEADQGQPQERDNKEADGRPKRDSAREEEEGNQEQEQQPGEDYQHHHQHQPHKEEGGGDKSCNTSMQTRMPGPRSQASQGGTSPVTE